MCLTITRQKETKKLRKQSNPVIVSWKLVEQRYENDYQTPFMQESIQLGQWLHSDRRLLNSVAETIRWTMNASVMYDVHHGIHTLQSLNCLYRYINRSLYSVTDSQSHSYYIAKCKALKNDLIACNKFGEMAFKKVFVCKQLYSFDSVMSGYPVKAEEK